jgi:hypothetical protein
MSLPHNAEKLQGGPLPVRYKVMRENNQYFSVLCSQHFLDTSSKDYIRYSELYYKGGLMLDDFCPTVD